MPHAAHREEPSMQTALKAGAVYFLLVFAAGFALGALRVLATAPALGETGAVILELPFMLTVSWIACGFVLRRFAVPPAPILRLAIGTFAFALLMIAEAGLSVLLVGRTLAGHFALYKLPPAYLGLIAQIAFALMPVLRGNVLDGMAPSPGAPRRWRRR
jgi:hypothetical protein